MSQELVTCLIAVAANLLGMVVIYSLLSQALARLAWDGRGTVTVIVLIAAAQLFWIAPALGIVEARPSGHAGSYALWFGNWLVCGFSLVVLWKSVARIPIALADAARIDGLGAFALWRQAVLPFVRRDLLILAAFTVMATLLPFRGCLTLPGAGSSIVVFQRFLSTSGRLVFMAVLSIAGALPLLGIFLLVRRRSLASRLPPLVRG
jgi:ABC-type glycerol-3-phosphate transport system permease component